MKKKWIKSLSAIFACATFALCFTACKEEHTHRYTEIITAPTCTEQGFTTHTCSCGDSYVDTYVNALEHNFVDYVSNNDATCTENGTETATCSRQGCEEKNTRTDENSALNHDYGMVTYTWNENQCTATRVCTRDNTHIETEVATAEYVKDTDATCTTAETGHYQATFENVAFETQTTNEDTVVNGEPLTHNYGTPTYVWNGYECTATRICGRDHTHQETETVTAVYVKDTDVTCDTPETGHYKATFNNSAFIEQNTAKDSVENGCALNHSYDVPTYTWNGNQCIAKRVCANDITHVETETVTGVYEKDTDVTCNEPEKGHYIATFTNNAFTTQTTANNSVDNGVKLGHSFIEYTYNNNATCEENGTETAICSRDNCTEPHTREKADTKLGHTYGTPTYTWNENQCTAKRICGRDTTHVDTETVTATYEKDTDVTCTAPEKGHYIATFTNSAFTTQTTADNTAENGEELGHSFINYTYNNNATCTENGTETAVCSRDNCDEPHTRAKENTALGHDWKKDGNPVVNCTLSGGTQSFKCGRCTATKNEAVTTVLSGAPNTHNGLSVGDVCQHCGKEVLAKNGNSLVMKIDENNYQVEHYEGKAVGFSKYKDYIKSAYISDSVTEIGNDAFYNYSALTSVEIPNSVTKIGNYVFYGCISLEKIEIPDSVTSLGTGVFEGCTGLKTLVLGNGLTEIKEGLLSGCSALENLTIPFVGNNVTETTASRSTLFGYIFGTGSFDGGTETKQYYTSDSYETYYIPTSLKSVMVLTGNILYGAFYNYSSLTSVVIGDGVTSIGDSAFYNCSSLTSVVIGDSVTSIGSYAFYDCGSLTSVVIGDGVTTIGEDAFYKCSNLTSVYITDIEAWCNISFGGVSANPLCYAKELYINNTLVTELNIPNAVTEIKEYSFYNCNSLKSIEIPDSVTSIGGSAFYGCSGLTTVKYMGDIAGWCTIEFDNYSANPMCYAGELYINDTLITELEIPNAVTEIKAYAFSGYSRLTSVEIPDSVTSIGSGAFYNCSSLTSVVIGDSVTSIGSSAFCKCTSLTSVVIGNGVTSIGEDAFYNCSSLTSVVIPDNVTSIGDYAFYGCSGLTTVKYMGDIAGWCNISFVGVYANPMCYAGELYINNTLITELEIPNAVTEIKAYAFSGYSRLTSVEIPDSVTSIGSGAFYNCSSLTSVVIGDSVTSIGSSAFYKCTSLTSVVIGNGVTSIGWGAFYNCSSLKSIEIPDSVTSIGEDAFWGCSNLEEITLPFVGETKNGTSNRHFGYIFGASSYNYNDGYVPTSLKKVTITGGNISWYAFLDCDSLTSVVIGDSVTSIGGGAFYNCSSLTSVYITDIEAWCNISFDGASANPLYYAKNLYLNNELVTELEIPNTVTEIKDYVFSGYSSLTSVVIGENVTSIGEGAFWGCSNLEEITLPFVGASKSATSASSSTVLGYIFGSSSYTGGTATEQYYSSLTDSYTTYYIPTSLKKVTVTGGKLLYGAFYNCNSLTSVVIGDSVTSIGYRAFYGCSGLTEITLPFVGETKNGTSNRHFGYIFGANRYDYNDDYVPTSLKKVTVTGGNIEGHAFANCSMIENIFINQEVTMIDREAFSDCDNLKFTEYDNAYYLGNDENEFFALIKAKNETIAQCIINDNTKFVSEYAFYKCSNLTSVEIPDGVTSIGNYAFSNCSSLTSIEIPDSVTSIGEDAFWGCGSLTSVVIGNGVTSIGEYTFHSCSGLTSVVIGNGVTSIGEYSFAYCSGLTRIEIPDSVTSIGSYAFYYCGSLTSVVIGDGVTTIGDDAFDYCNGLTSVCITDIEAWCNISFGGVYANPLYYAKNLYLNNELVTELEIPNTVTGIKSYAFSGCSRLTSVVIGENVTSIGLCAFYNCSRLTNVKIPDSVKSIVWGAFEGCSGLTSITIPDSVTSIGQGAFEGCSGLTEITLPFVGETKNGTSNRHFGYIFGAYEYDYNYDYVPTSLKSVTVLGGNIFYGAFSGCSRLTSIEIPDSVTSVGDYAFSSCSSLKSIEIPDSVTSIGNYAFSWCRSLTSVKIPDGVTSIGNYAFYSCDSLTSVVIGDGVTTIGEDAFEYCNGLTSVCITDIEAWCNISFGGVYANPLYYAKNLYLNNELVTELEIPNTVTEIKAYAFYNCDSLTSVEIGDGVTSIGDRAFCHCSSLTNITVSQNNTAYKSIDGNLYTKDGKTIVLYAPGKLLTSFVILDGVTSIGNYAFSNCSSLTSIEIPDGVTSIGNYAFSNCSSLTSIEIPDSVTSIGEDAFWGCGSLTSVVIGDGVTSIGSYAFLGCDGLTSVKIPDSVTSIGSYAFYSCDSLTSITFEDTSTWYRTTSIMDWSEKRNGTYTRVTSPSTNATYFTSNYDYYTSYWYKL